MTASTKSERSAQDAASPIGMGATDIVGRMAASIGGFGATEPKFLPCHDVAYGGVMLALPALLVTGLLSRAETCFQLSNGYYRLDSIFLLLALMALARIKSVEMLRHCCPGEWGKLLGLDRIPEAKTLREKIGILSSDDKPSQWAAQLNRDWMAKEPEAAGILYIDGHVRVYTGHQTQLPRHYVARQKLCLRATTDYWVNAMDGQPFFVVNKEVDPGLIKVLEEDMVPRMEIEVPAQPNLVRLEEDPLLHRFTLVFDREGYSPGFFLRMRDKRIACLSYHKYPAEKWPEEEFVSRMVKLVSDHEVEMKLAERGVFLGGKLWVREIRKLTDSGHQTSILSTDYQNDLVPVAAAMFARWCQENFFKYMREHYNLDRLVDYSTEAIVDTLKVVNPAYRTMDSKVRHLAGKLTRKSKEFGALMLQMEIAPENVEEYQHKKGNLQEEIGSLEREVEHLKAERKKTKKHITMGELPEEERFSRLATQSKYLIDTIKMIAYRSETCMANIVQEEMSHKDEARSLLRAIYKSDADIVPDYEAGTLTVRLHQLANRSSAETIRHLCSELNATETIFPGTKLRLIYELVT